jgi:hypothetical protein
LSNLARSAFVSLMRNMFVRTFDLANLGLPVAMSVV